MTYVNQNRRPTKRCRRGKNNTGSSINFKALLNCAPVTFQMGHYYGYSGSMGLLFLLSLAFFIILSYFINANLSEQLSFIDNYFFTTPIFLCSLTSSKLTKEAIERIKEFHRPNKRTGQKNTITKRDIDRFFFKHNNDQRSLKELRKENKALKGTIRRIKKKQLQQAVKKILLQLLTITTQIIIFPLFIILKILPISLKKKIFRLN